MVRVRVLLSDAGVGTFERLLRAGMIGEVLIRFLACKRQGLDSMGGLYGCIVKVLKSKWDARDFHPTSGESC